jgi:hypothetical protein
MGVARDITAAGQYGIDLAKKAPDTPAIAYWMYKLHFGTPDEQTEAHQMLHQMPGQAAAIVVPGAAEGVLADTLELGQARMAAKAAAPEAETAAPEAAEAAPKASPSAKPVTAADVEKQINDALGGKGLEPNTPLRAQTNLGKAAAATAEPTALPKGFTASDSSAIKGYRYDGDAEQLTTIDRKTGTVYTHAEVSPSEFEKFENADSQGKFWNTNIRANHALVLKNGLPFRPAGSQNALRNILAGGE